MILVIHVQTNPQWEICTTIPLYSWYSVATQPHSLQAPVVDEIKDDQALNPYTEIQLLMHHTDIVRHLTHVGDNWFVASLLF